MSLSWKIPAVVLAMGLSFYQGWNQGRSEVDTVKATYAQQIAEAGLAAKVQNETAAANHREREAADAVTLSSLKQQLQDLDAYLDASPNGGNVCLSGADTERLRGLW